MTQLFEVYLIRPTRYDDDGYPIQWLRSIIPSNSLACLSASGRRRARGIARPGRRHRHRPPIDEFNAEVDVDAIIAGRGAAARR